MSLSPSGLAVPTTGAIQHPRLLLTSILACCALLATAAFGPTMYAVAQTLRPTELNHISGHHPLPISVIDAAVDASNQRMTLILLIGMLVIVVFIAAALITGRVALRRAPSPALIVRLEKWSSLSLLTGGALALIVTLLSASPATELIGNLVIPLLSLAATILAGSFILSGIALRRANKSTLPQGQVAWHRGAWFSIVLAPLLLLLWFFLVNGLAHFTISFYLLFVF